MKAIAKIPMSGAVACFILFIFAVCLGQINAQDTLAEKAVTSSITLAQTPSVVETESPFNLSITWMSIAGWFLGFMWHTSIKMGKTVGKDNMDKVKKFFRLNLFKYIGSIISAILLLILLIALVDAVNSSEVNLEKLPSFIKDYGNFFVAFACVFMGFGNSSFMLWILKVGKEKAKLDYQDEELDETTGPASGMKP